MGKKTGVRARNQKKAPPKNNGKHPGGRPIEYTLEVIADIANRLETYITKTPNPILAEFAYKNYIPRQAFYEHPEFSDILKRITDKKEAYLERLLLSGTPHVAAGCIFALKQKQFGWRDRMELAGDPQNPLLPINLVETIIAAYESRK